MLIPEECTSALSRCLDSNSRSVSLVLAHRQGPRTPMFRYWNGTCCHCHLHVHFAFTVKVDVMIHVVCHLTMERVTTNESTSGMFIPLGGVKQKPNVYVHVHFYFHFARRFSLESTGQAILWFPDFINRMYMFTSFPQPCLSVHWFLTKFACLGQMCVRNDIFVVQY